MSVADSVTLHRPPRYHEFDPSGAAGAVVNVVTGATVSSVNVTECVASTFPALSTDQNVTVCDPSDTENGALYVCCEPPSTV